MYFQGIVKVGKANKIIKSNHQPDPPCTLTVSLSATSPWFFNTSRDDDSTGQPSVTLNTTLQLFLRLSEPFLCLGFDLLIFAVGPRKTWRKAISGCCMQPSPLIKAGDGCVPEAVLRAVGKFALGLGHF